MIEKISAEDHFVYDIGWIKSRYHFSFAGYNNPLKMNFGYLRVFNDNVLKSGEGFETHPHKDMEIISYCIDGELTHKDSMGATELLKSGDIQYISAGTGIFHSEINKGKNKTRFIQMWIMPGKRGLKPSYAVRRLNKEDKKNKLLKIVSGIDGDGIIKIYQNTDIFVGNLEPNKSIEHKIKYGNSIYLTILEGSGYINGICVGKRDAVKMEKEELLSIESDNGMHVLFLEIK